MLKQNLQNVRQDKGTKGDHAAPALWRQRPWYCATVALPSLAILVLGSLLLKKRLFPTYWTIEDLGPVAVSTRPAPSPAPTGMVWIPGGVFQMGSDEFPHS